MNEREIFAKALLLPDPAERTAFLAEACGTDGASRRRIEELLALHERPHLLLDRPPLELLGESGDGHVASPQSAIQQLAPFLSPSPRPGALGRVGHYDVLAVLGQGGFGIVARAFDDSLQRVVAIKLLAPHLAATSPPRKRFLREARAAAQVKHENVVQTYAVEEQPLPYLVMEFVEGQTLQHKLDRDGPLEAPEVVRLGSQIALGLAAAHDKGLIHRDVKPANILLEAGIEPRARLTDFGLARAGDDASLTQSGVIAGTPMFMAPEQAKGEVLDHRADLFSLGSVLYTMASGRPPFRAPNTPAVLRRVAEDTPRPIREVNADVPHGLCAVIMRLLEKKPADRFATAREAAQALSRCLSDPAPTPVARRPRRRGVAAVFAVSLVIAGTLSLPWWFDPADRGPGRSSDGENESQAATAPAPKQSTDVPAPKPAVRPPSADIVVTRVADDGSEGTLRWAVNEANTRPGPDTIGFEPSVFDTPRTITLTQGELRFTDTAQTTIIGPKAGLTISGSNNKTRVFNVEVRSPGAVTVALQRLTLIGGDLGDGGNTRGGVIWNRGDLYLDQVTVAGGRCNFGGGISSEEQSTLRVHNCTFKKNASAGGGAILSLNRLTVINSTFTENWANHGGGAICIAKGSGTIINATVSGNTAEEGGVFIDVKYASSLMVVNTIVVGNKHFDGSANDLWGDMTVKNCLLGSTANVTLLPESTGNITGVAARLGKLGRHGGLTETFPLLLGSPAIDAGSNALVPSSVRTDQRGLSRIAGGTVDIGAFEVQ